jgi:cation transport ATPase
MTDRGPLREREEERVEDRRVREETSHEMMDHGEDRREETRVVEEPGHATSERVTHDRAEEQRRQFFKIRQLVWTLMGILLGFLGLRFVLMLLGANAQAPFAAFIYGVTDLFVAPFQGLLGDPQFNGMVLETTTLVAIAVYALFTWGVLRLLWVAGYRTEARTVSRTTREEYPADDELATRRDRRRRDDRGDDGHNGRRR